MSNGAYLIGKVIEKPRSIISQKSVVRHYQNKHELYES